MDRSKRIFLGMGLAALLSLTLPEILLAEPRLKIIDKLSEKTKKRAKRLGTDFILLHTTEGEFSGALRTLRLGGKANYLIAKDGNAYRIMGRDQISIGAGRSMWGGVSNLDNYAVNIEFVGTYTREPTEEQLQSGKELIDMLRRTYPRISDDHIMPHSMVAYGTPNRWNRNSHRGRKKGCGMLFATEDIRKKLGIGPAPKIDPDVMAGRLVVGNSDLERVLYGGDSTLTEEKPDEPESYIYTIGEKENVWMYAGNELYAPSTIYFLKDGRIRTGEDLVAEGFNFDIVGPGIKLLVGYVYGGHVAQETKDLKARTPYSIAGKKWNLPSTLYVFPDKKVKTGDDINSRALPQGTFVFFRR